MLVLPVERIEPSLQWALACIAVKGFKLDWVKMTDDLSIWQREEVRLNWASQFLQISERKQSC